MQTNCLFETVWVPFGKIGQSIQRPIDLIAELGQRGASSRHQGAG